MNGSLNLGFDNLCYHVRGGIFSSPNKSKQILKGISGDFRAGELSIVMGPSGCGKSSLLNVLSGLQTSQVSGTINLNENKISSSVIRKIASYIMQETALHEYLTVKETVMFAASFKSHDQGRRHEKIERILKSLGMKDKLDTFVKNLSGGQQKRLTIAMELVDNPSILFLDEPTTGLDSSSSTQCIRLLKELAKEGKTVICTIHAPSALMFDLFDRIYALADGQCIYQGSSRNLVPFLKEIGLICPPTFNPSDFLLEIATNDYGDMNDILTAKSGNGSINVNHKPSTNNQSFKDEFKLMSSSIYSQSYLKQIQFLSHRSILISRRDKTLISLRLLIHLVLGITFGFLYKNVGEKVIKTMIYNLRILCNEKLFQASTFLDNYRFVITSVVFQLYTSYWSLQTASE